MKNITKGHFVDLHQLWGHVESVPVEDRLREIFRCTRTQTHDQDGFYVSSSKALIAGVGGLPVQIYNGTLYVLGQPTTAEMIQDHITSMIGFGGFMAYLNPKNKAPQVIMAKMCELGHFSNAHAVSVNVLVLGISCAVENEFNCQRDLITASRVTVARALAQDNPPIMVLDKSTLPLIKEIRETAIHLLEGKVVDREVRNNMFSASKATMILLSGSLRNFQKLVSAKDDSGKEREFRTALHKIEDTLSTIAPSLFCNNQLKDVDKAE